MTFCMLTERILDLQTYLHQIPVSQKLSILDRGYYLALNYLMMHEKMAYPKELSRGMVVSSARIAVLLNHMEEEKLISRTPDPQDNRQVIVRLTDKGVETIQKKRKEIAGIVMEALEDLGQEDAEALVRILEKMVQNSLRHSLDDSENVFQNGRKED